MISSRFRKLRPNRRYHRTHRTMISASKWRPLNSAGRFRLMQSKAYQTGRNAVCNTSSQRHSPTGSPTRYVIRDRDGVYGNLVNECIASLGMEQVLTAPQSPWQNPYAERLIGTIRRECLNHFVILNALHLRRTLRLYFRYYHASRTHLGLAEQCPFPATVFQRWRDCRNPAARWSPSPV